MRIVGGAWATIDPSSGEAATVLGAGPWQRLREVTLPQLAPSLSASAALTFLFCFTSFGVILILGGPGRATLETEIYNRAARQFDLEAAAVLSLLQLGAVAIVLAVASILEGRAGVAATLTSERDVLRRPTPREHVALVSVLGLAAARARSPARRSRRPVARQLGRALPGDARASRRAVADGRLLDRLRRRRDRDRPPRRRARGPRARAKTARCSRRLRPACRSAPLR